MKALIAPSLLAADFANLEREIRRVEDAGAEILHIDVMDGHFVPNLTVGLPVVESIRRVTPLHLDVHLMLTNPEEMAPRFADAGANSVTVHYEAATHLDLILNHLRAKGVWAGVTLNPHTPVSALEEVLPLCDLVLLMSVNPGYGGQRFISSSLEKVRKLRLLARLLGHGELRIEIDGGITRENVPEVVRAGVDLVVAGTAVFGPPDSGEAFRSLQAAAEEASSGRD